MADGRLTSREKEACRREIREAIDALNALDESIVSEGRPVGVSAH